MKFFMFFKRLLDEAYGVCQIRSFISLFISLAIHLHPIFVVFHVEYIPLNYCKNIEANGKVYW